MMENGVENNAAEHGGDVVAGSSIEKRDFIVIELSGVKYRVSFGSGTIFM